MKIAGSTFDEQEGEEIEEIVKVSLIARRIKNLPNKKKIQREYKNTKTEIFNEENVNINLKPNVIKIFTARGLI